jgi:mannose-P-dolichol utilization defect protein 1
MDLPVVLRDPLVALITPACYTDLFLNYNLSNVDCIKLLISKGLGLGLVAGGALLKLPQVAKIVHARSGEGLSVNSLIIETLGFGLMLAYNLRLNNAFSTYGEGFFIFAQNVIILTLIYKYNGNLLTGIALALGCVASFFALNYEGITSFAVLTMLQAGSIPLLLAGKVPQIIQNHQDKSTGQLSAFTVFAMFLGAAARVFTTLQEVDDLVSLLMIAV